MDQQKAVVILLLITIILSVFSVIVTIGGGDIANKTRTVTQKETLITNGPQAGNVNLVIAKAGGAP